MSEENYNESKEEKLKAARVDGHLKGIGENPFKGLPEEAKIKLGHTFGTLILNDLPQEVYSFQHSDELPEINAQREIGFEKWDAKDAKTWSDGVLNSFI